MPSFSLLRFSLSSPQTGPLLENVADEEPKIDRRDFLKYLFGERCEFIHMGRCFVFTPSPTNQDDDPMMSGYFGKEISRRVQTGPENLHAETTNQYWTASFFAIDTRATEQLGYFEQRDDMGSPQAILMSLASQRIKDFRGKPWVVDIEYKTKTNDFWAAVEKFKGNITEVEFEFVPANGLSGYDKIKELTKHVMDPSNADRSSLTIKKSDGSLDPKGEYVEGALEYAAEGAGRTKMKSGRNVVFSSEESNETKDAPEEIMPREGEKTKILGLISFLLGERK